MMSIATTFRLVAPLLLAFAAFGARGAELFEPCSPDDVASDTAMPERITCQDGAAFGMTLGQASARSDVKVVRRGLHWAGDVTVTEFAPSSTFAPFARYYWFETPRSKEVVWSMAVSFHADEAKAKAAARRYAQWYGRGFGKPLRPDVERDAYVLKAAPGVVMTIIADGRSVQVSCEHGATFAKALTE